MLNPHTERSEPLPLQDMRPASSAGAPSRDALASTASPQTTEQPAAPPGDGVTESWIGRLLGLRRGKSETTPPQTQSGLDAQIDRLAREGQLDALQTAYLRDRWLDQTKWLGGRARKNQRRHYILRLITILGGVAIPALVGLEINSNETEEYVRWLTFGLGLLVAAAAALEEFFRYGERWRHYRHHAELLKAEGWAFLQLVGPAYATFATHAVAFRTFVSRVEEAMHKRSASTSPTWRGRRNSSSSRAKPAMPTGRMAVLQRGGAHHGQS